MCGEDSGQMSTGRHLLLVTAREVVRKCDTCHVTIVTTHTSASECSYLGVMLWQVLRWIKQNIEGSLVDYF